MHPIMVAMGRPLTQITFGAAGAGAAFDSSSPLSVPYPSGIVAGSFLVLHVLARASSGISITTPDGWAIITGLQTGVSQIDRLFWKRADGSEAGNLDVTVSVSGGGAIGRMYRFSRGFGVEAANSAADVSADTGVEAVDVTSTKPKAIAVQCLTHFANTTIAAINGESGANYTEAVAEFGDASYPATLSCQVAELPSPTAVTGGSATAGASATHNSHGFVIR